MKVVSGIKCVHSIKRTIFFYMVFLVCLGATIVAVFRVVDETKRFNEEIIHLRQEYIQNQKRTMDNEVNRVHDYIEFTKLKAEESLKTTIKDRTYVAYDIIKTIYDENKGEKSDDEIKKMIINILGPIRFNKGRGYYFITTLKGDDVLNPVWPDSEGVNFNNLKDDNGNNLINEEIDFIKRNKEGFIEEKWIKPGESFKNMYPKLSYIKCFEPFNWYIGTGEYIDDFEKELQNQVSKRISQIKYGYQNEQYIFMTDYKGIMIANGGFPELIGKDVWDLEDDNGVKVTQQGIDFTRENPDGGFLTQHWLRKNSNQTSEKLYFVKIFKEWNWVIGTGIYMDEVDEVIELKRQTLYTQLFHKILHMIVGCISFVIFAGILTKVFSEKINNTFKMFTYFFNKASSENVYIDVNKVYYSELKELASSANVMIDKRKVVENKMIEINEELKKCSMTDGLTGLYNHKYIHEKLHNEIKNSSTSQKSLSIIMFDIDHFKKVNDTFGHQVGDIVLRNIANLIKKEVGQTSCVGRYGGEEFLIILPDADLDNAYLEAQNIRNKVKNMVFEDENLKVTISGGVVQLKKETGHDLIRKADNLLYRAKENGRDRIEK